MDLRTNAIEIVQNKEAIMISGGGALGIAEIGSLERLEEIGFSLKNLKKVKGSSVGSIIATAIACEASVKYMKDMIFDMDLTSFRDYDGLLLSGIQLLCKYGLNKTGEIRRFVSKILTDLVGNPEITFLELYQRTGVHLIITYLSMNLEQTVYADHLTEPNSSILETIVKSSSIPLFYEGYFEGKGKDKTLAVDGGTLDNYSFKYLRDGVDPVKVFGLKLVSGEDVYDDTNVGIENAQEFDKGFPKNVIEYFTRLIYLMRKQAMKLHVHKNDWMSSIKINVGSLTSTDFHITDAEKEWLFNQGRRGVDAYLDELTELLKEGEYPYV